MRSHWYPNMQQLHWFVIAVSQVAVNHDGKGGSAPDPLVWDQGAPGKARKTDIRVNVDHASLPGPCGFLHGPWMQVHCGCSTGLDVVAWPYSVGILCDFTAFLGSLHGPVGAVDMGHLGVSFWILILFEQWAGLRLLSETVTRPHFRPIRHILIPSAPVSEGVESRQRCQFVSSLVGALSKLLAVWVGSCHVALVPTCQDFVIWGGINAPMVIPQDHWNLVTTSALGHEGSAAELLDGSLKLRFFTTVFTKQFPPWVLPRLGKGVGKRRAVTSGNPLDC